MTPLENVQNLYAAYLDEAAAAEKNQHYTDGFLGFGKKASDDPCHVRFIEKLTALVKETAESSISSAEMRDVIAFIFQAQQDHREPASIYWALVAAHSAVQEGIPLLTPEDTAALYQQYDSMFRRFERLPVQTKILKQLKKAMR